MLLRSALSASAEVRQEIHFETLWAQAQEMLDAQSGQLWTDTAEHDPGVTLLQALNYGVADLAYRHTLPLQDLLTPSLPEQSEAGLFPVAFGPQRALTVSPITEDDYRRALLDLTDAEDRFLFRDARLLMESEEERYRYYYLPALREFHFNPGDNAQAFTVQGFYRLQVELNRDITRVIAEPILEKFVQDHRNICEGVRSIDWLGPQPVDVALVIELDDDFQDFAGLLAQVFHCVEDFVSPQAQRKTAEQLRQDGLGNEIVYQGPMLRHGWITQLPLASDYQRDRSININPLASTLQRLDGVASLQVLRFDGAGWTTTIAAQHYLQLWGADPLQKLADGNMVRLLKRGQQVILSKEEIAPGIVSRTMIQESPEILPYGRHRVPAIYYPASGKIPPCYGLLRLDPDRQEALLHQFLLPFEQHLTNGARQLAMLPALLSFQRDVTAPSEVWGGQWPFAGDALIDRVANEVHALYRDRLAEHTAAEQQNVEQELDILNYLLGYFGQRRADRTLFNAPDYLASQRHYLSQSSELYYAAGQFRADAISAIQRRIAARLGFAENIFDAEANMAQLPFYLVEHASLLPRRPSTDFDDTWQAVSTVTDNDNDNGTLTLSLPQAVSEIYPGQLLELQLSFAGTEMTLSACVVLDVAVDNMAIKLEINARMRSALADLTDAASTVQWRNSSMWLQDIHFALNYVDNPEDAPNLPATEEQRVITVQNFPADLDTGSIITLYRDQTLSSPALQKFADGDIEAMVLAVDVLQRQALIGPVPGGAALPQENTKTRYRWRIRRGTDDPLTDRYSFTVSVVFRADLLGNVAEPYTTDAWLRQIVQEELPCHVRGEIHWFDAQYFREFANNYAQWMAAEARLGIFAFNLIEMLGLGLLPSGLMGINAMRIATVAQRELVVGADETQWNTEVIKELSLFYVPPAS